MYLNFPLNNRMAKTCCCIWRADNNYAIVSQSGFDQGYTTKNKKITVLVLLSESLGI